MARNKIFLGTELKLNVNIAPMGNQTMETYDWQVEISCGSFGKQKVVIPKADAKKGSDANNYLVRVDTNLLGVGKMKIKITAYLDDGDFPDRKRTEIEEIDPGIEIVKGL